VFDRKSVDRVPRRKAIWQAAEGIVYRYRETDPRLAACPKIAADRNTGIKATCLIDVSQKQKNGDM
jgi:hypothetical protein